jgi:hypothetical protein
LTERPVTFVHLYIKHENTQNAYTFVITCHQYLTNIKLDRSPVQSQLVSSFNNSELHNAPQRVTRLRVNGHYFINCSTRNDSHIDGMECDSNWPRVLNILNNKTQNGVVNFRLMS